MKYLNNFNSANYKRWNAPIIREITQIQEFMKMKQKWNEMSATIEDLKARCIWLSDSLIKQRRTLENKFNILAEQFKKINTSSAQDLGNLLLSWIIK